MIIALHGVKKLFSNPWLIDFIDLFIEYKFDFSNNEISEILIYQS